MDKVQSERLSILATENEVKELRDAGLKIVESSPISGGVAAFQIPVVKLKRTFTMAGMRFWRVISPSTHPNYQSDLSIQGLKDFQIAPQWAVEDEMKLDESLIRKAWGL